MYHDSISILSVKKSTQFLGKLVHKLNKTFD